MSEPKRPSTGRSQRQLRVGESIRHALSAIFEREEFRDPVLAATTVTVTEVRVSPDLRNATAFVLPLGGETDPELVEALGRATPFLRKRLGEKMTLKRLPQLAFERDVSFDNADRISELLRQVATDGPGDGGGRDGA